MTPFIVGHISGNAFIAEDNQRLLKQVAGAGLVIAVLTGGYFTWRMLKKRNA